MGLHKSQKLCALCTYIQHHDGGLSYYLVGYDIMLLIYVELIYKELLTWIQRI
jgi:hypothetical protein